MVLAAHPSPNQRLKKFSPRKDSPSRQLNQELDYALEQLVLHDHERKKLHAYQRRAHNEELEARDTALAKSHMAALDAASARHEAVRHEAEAILQRHLREQEEIRLRREAEERARIELEARQRAERERKAREDAERKAKEERERREAEEAKARREAEAKALAERDAAEQKAREATAQKEAAQKVQAEKSRLEKEAAATAAAKAQAEREATEQRNKQNDAAASARQTSDHYSASSTAENIHNEYLALHKKLKDFRKKFWEQAKTDKPLKAAVGDMRRAMRTSVGQLTDDKVGNKKAQERVKTNITKALTEVQSPPVPVNEYLPPHLHHSDNPRLPSLVIYLLSIFSKAIIAAFAAEVAVNPRAAEPIGTLTAQVFSMNELQLPDGKGSLIPILMAKFHASAPILFGVSGPETTAAGRVRLGWRTELKNNDSKKSFVIEQRHHERMTGLGAGYASIALRNFSRTKLKNPYPPTQFWQSLSHIVNTPPQAVTTSHLLLLKAMLDNNAPDRFILFFGSAGIAGLREVLVEFPNRLPEKVQTSAAARSIGLMVNGLAKERHFRLT